ncbi:MAG: hypothetical protein CLLPBCKN_007261 [Chroococcidiopsis cubana SAG 39.79]|nr:hypothetical protein [Chroococcidiopsis cubana SAG 39.79]
MKGKITVFNTLTFVHIRSYKYVSLIPLRKAVKVTGLHPNTFLY